MAPPSEELFPRPLSGARVKDLPSGLIPARSALEGREVILEPIDPARHGAGLFDVASGSEDTERLWDYMPYGPFADEAAFNIFLNGCAGNFETIFYAIRLKQSGQLSGMASYLEIKPAHGAIEIGHIWFAPHLQRTRAATEALFVMLDHAMSDLHYRRMQWKCNALNAKSRNAAHRLGFRYEGIHHNALIVKGQNRDTAWYSILGDEWPDVCARLTEWLAGDNFDANGQARQALSQMMADRPSSRRA